MGLRRDEVGSVVKGHAEGGLRRRALLIWCYARLFDHQLKGVEYLEWLTMKCLLGLRMFW